MELMSHSSQGNQSKIEHWNTKLGVILAVAGSAIGLGNFLRFPGLAAKYGSGAFMIAYFVSFLLLGLPMAWVEWTMGRRAGRHGLHGAPFMFVALTGMPWTRYVGILQLLVPLGIYFYYINIEAWCLGYAANFASGTIHFTGPADAGLFFAQMTGLGGNGTALGTALGNAGMFLGVCVVINLYLLYKGISKGIEKFCLYATPALFVIALVVLARVLTLGTPDHSRPDNNILNGLGYMWNPQKVVIERQTPTPAGAQLWVAEKEIIGEHAIATATATTANDPERRVRTITMWEQLGNPLMWMSAASQVFLSLSIGFGLIFCYASYLRRSYDVVLGTLAATSANEFAEIAMGGMLSIPAGFAFLGVAGVAGAGTFGLGFNVLPMVFSLMPGGSVFGMLFFILLFIAAVTSSISIIQPILAYFEETMSITRRQAVAILSTITTLGGIFVAYFSSDLKAVDTLDFWMGTFSIFVLATIQMVLFAWVIGVDTIFKEMKLGASMMPHPIFQKIIKYVTPLFLISVGGLWIYYELLNLDGGTESTYVSDLFIERNGVAMGCVLFMVLSAIFLVMILRPKSHFVHLAKRAKELERSGE